MKARLKGAQTGHSLLKKKADALQMRFRLILKKIIEVAINFHLSLTTITFITTVKTDRWRIFDIRYDMP